MAAELLGKVEYSNLLQINWNEQKIQTNFRLIVEAMQTQQADNANIKDQLSSLREEIERVDKKTSGKSTKELTLDNSSGGDKGKDDGLENASELRNSF